MSHYYKETDKMIDLISGNYSLLMVMSRFGLNLGFGEKSVKGTCEECKVDYKTFLIVVNFLNEGHFRFGTDLDEISVNSLMVYLKNAHSYFLDFALPAIRRKLIEAIDCSDNEVAILILKFFDEYAEEVRRHMNYEDQQVFKYAEDLANGNVPENYRISIFSRKHDQLDSKLSELKNIIIKYYPAKGNNNLLNSVLFDIYSCEADLASHCKIEDYILVPAILKLEKNVLGNE